LIDLFRAHVEADIWSFLPVTDTILRTTATLVRGLPASIPLRAGDAIHVATALDSGEPEIWTNDRHLLAAATYFGLAGRSVDGQPAVDVGNKSSCPVLIISDLSAL
jgi:hypothetical protein